ncbi:hypothetical protein GGI19_004626 [Coemansia pectinata]|uniref:SANTA domain-containing protein n=1 Tax=Coemansia pectinata TaxID=1052879 RepID=A0A9W8GRV5_9FUNG|nr:hypothetical protein GGI19_004626 [Coemansia pectinata]
MSGRGHRDNANFLDRIKNVDVLKSPYPRHLAPAVRTPTAAHSARPCYGRGGALFSPVQPVPAPAPAPVHAYSYTPPVRPNPVVRPGALSVSSVGAVGYAGPAGFGYHSSAAHHRAIPDYPNSVQPIRARAYASPEQRHVPGSSRPAHLPGAGASGEAISLYNWHVGIDPAKRSVIVLGSYDKPSGETVNRHSSTIKTSLSSHMLLSIKDAVYVLVGPVNEAVMRAKGFPEYLIRAFSQGFPRNWEKLTNDFMDHLANPQQDGARSSVRSHDFARPSPLPLMRDDSLEGYYQSGIGSDRFDAIAEDEEVSEADEPPTSSGLSGSFRGLAFDRTAHIAEAPSIRPRGSSSSSVYRSGSALFANGRFAKPDMARAADVAPPVVAAEPVPEHIDRQSDDGFDVMAQSDSVVGDEETAPGFETAVPDHEDNAIAEADVEANSEGESASAELHVPDDVASSGSEPVTKANDKEQPEMESLDTATPSCVGRAMRVTAAANDVITPRRRSQLRVIESSDESIPNEAASTPSTKPIKPARRVGTRLSAGAVTGLKAGSPVGTKTTRRTSLNTPTKPASESTPKATGAVPTSRLKGNNSVPKKRPVAKVRRSSALVAATTASPEPPADEDPFAVIPNIAPNDDDLVTTPTKRRGRAWGQARAAEKRAEEPQPTAEEATPPAATEPDETSEVEGPAEDADADADSKADVSAMRTPKRKIGRNYFKYNEPKQSTAITRSGRKIHKPKEWWANAQERLSEGHKESNFKYRWGSGDAVIIKGDKRIRLSDYYLEDSAQGLLFDDSGDAKERDDNGDSHSEASASEK